MEGIDELQDLKDPDQFPKACLVQSRNLHQVQQRSMAEIPEEYSINKTSGKARKHRWKRKMVYRKSKLFISC